MAESSIETTPARPVPPRLPPGYEPILDKTVEVLAKDDRVRAAWLHGSVARGDADEVSDMDVICAVTDDNLSAYGAGWRQRLEEITPTVMARSGFGTNGNWLSITPEACRFDLWVEPVSHVATSPVRDRRVLFDRDSLNDRVPAPRAPQPRSEVKLDELRAWASDCWAVQREASGQLRIECVHTLRWILYWGMVELNRPLPATGLKQWSSKLTTGQRLLFEALPTDDPGPVWSAISDWLGPVPKASKAASIERAFVVPEGYIRGLKLAEAPPAERSRHLTDEFLALHLYLSVVVHRSDWLLGVEGVYSQRRLLREAFFEINGRRPAGDVGSWEDCMSAPQRRVLHDLPTGRATQQAVIGDHLAVKDSFVALARSTLGGDYPYDLQQTVEEAVAACVVASTPPQEETIRETPATDSYFARRQRAT
jgi:predicted nucleotidyltransferase